VICPTCDEVFRPTFARRCENCGHDNAEDTAADALIAVAGTDDSTHRAGRRTPLRTLRLILAIIAAVGVAYTLYDWLMSNTGGARLF
jgi:type VI protein secretion system component VasF